MKQGALAWFPGNTRSRRSGYSQSPGTPLPPLSAGTDPARYLASKSSPIFTGRLKGARKNRTGGSDYLVALAGPAPPGFKSNGGRFVSPDWTSARSVDFSGVE